MNCIFTSCNNSELNTPVTDVTAYFKFPTEPSLCAAWLEALHKKDWQPDDESAVCSKHFLPHDMERCSSGLLTLRVGAVPVVNVEVCRICLARNCKLYSIKAYKTLHQAYETLTGLMIQSEDNLPPQLCNECAHQLLMFTRFRNRSLETHSVLLEIYTKHKCITEKSLNTVQGILNVVESNQMVVYDIEKEISEIENIDNNKQTDRHEEVTVYCVKLENDDVVYQETAEVEALTDNVMVYISLENLQEYTVENSLKAENDDAINQDYVNKESSNIDKPGDALEGNPMDDTPQLEEDRQNAVQSAIGESEATVILQNINNIEDDTDNKQEAEGEFEDDSYQSKDGRETDKQNTTNLQMVTSEEITSKEDDDDAVRMLEALGDTSDKTFPIQVDVPSTESNPTGLEKVRKIHKDLSPTKDCSNRKAETEGSSLSNGHFTCDICHFQTNTVYQLMSHLKAHAASTSYNCEKCGYKTIHKRSLTWHLKVHSGEKPYSCNRCNKAFIKESHLQFHVREHLGEKPYLCDLCNKGFSRKDCLKVHLKGHSGEKPYSCNICNKAYTGKFNLKKHLRIHLDGSNNNTKKKMLQLKMKSDKKPYICNVCTKAFIRKTSFQKHVRKHLDGTLTCHVCKESFTEKTSLELHLRIHPGEEPYTCNICDKVFQSKSILVKHNLRTHSGDEPHSCHVCNKVFISKEYLRSHLLVHSVEKQYSCKICNKGFIRKSYLQKHMRQHSGVKPYTCDVCKKSFLTKDTIKVHLRTHSGEKPFSCDICKKTFSKKYGLNKHSKTHFKAKA